MARKIRSEVTSLRGSRVRQGTGISCVCCNPCAYAHGSNGKDNLTGRVFTRAREGGDAVPE